MGERIAGNQDRPSLIIEDSLRAPKIAPKVLIRLLLYLTCTLLLNRGYM